jgi:hypothetical protein
VSFWDGGNPLAPFNGRCPLCSALTIEELSLRPWLLAPQYQGHDPDDLGLVGHERGRTRPSVIAWIDRVSATPGHASTEAA